MRNNAWWPVWAGRMQIQLNMLQRMVTVWAGFMQITSSQYGACGMKYGRRGQTWWTDAESHDSAAKVFERRMPDGLRRV